MLLNFTNAKVTKKTRNAIESTTFLCNSYVFRVLYLFRQKAIPPLFLLTKIGANSMKRRSFTDFAPTLHRLCTDFGTEDQRRIFLVTTYLT